MAVDRDSTFPEELIHDERRNRLLFESGAVYTEGVRGNLGSGTHMAIAAVNFLAWLFPGA